MPGCRVALTNFSLLIERFCRGKSSHCVRPYLLVHKICGLAFEQPRVPEVSSESFEIFIQQHLEMSPLIKCLLLLFTLYIISFISIFLFVVIYDLCCLYCLRLFCLVKLYAHYIAYAEIASPRSISICFFRVRLQHCYHLILFHCIVCWLIMSQINLTWTWLDLEILCV